VPGIRVFEFDLSEENNFQYVIILVDEERFGHSRQQLVEALQDTGVLARRYFSPGCHAMEPYKRLYPDAAERLPVTETVSRQVLALPTGTQLGPTEIKEICEFIRRFQSKG
jgi:dTDP-4-amino-4,6-dideoxyglucose